MAGGRPKHRGDNPMNPRQRRKPTEKEKEVQQEKALATKRKRKENAMIRDKLDSAKIRPARNFFLPQREINNEVEQLAHTGLQVEEERERERTVNRSNESSTQLATAADNDEVVTFNNPIPTRVVCPSPRDVVANLDIDDDEGYEDEESDDDEDLDDSSNEKQSSTCTLGIQQQYIRAVQERIQHEVSSKFPATEKRWMMEYLKENHWTIRREDGPKIAKHLCLKLHHVSYYRRVDVWLPDIRWGALLTPSCPKCKTNRRVSPHGFHCKHYGRIVVDWSENYFIITCRYICYTCARSIML